jgi:hypothetical protein
MKTKVQSAWPEHEIAYQDLCALLDKHAGKMNALEMLAIASNMVGKIVAMQDQRRVTPEMAMKVVSENIEYGNRQVLAQLDKSGGIA